MKGREARRLQASVPVGELAQSLIAGRASVEAGKVDVEPEQHVQSPVCGGLGDRPDRNANAMDTAFERSISGWM